MPAHLLRPPLTLSYTCAAIPVQTKLNQLTFSFACTGTTAQAQLNVSGRLYKDALFQRNTPTRPKSFQSGRDDGAFGSVI